MIFEVDPHPNSDLDVEQKPINWIKEFRYQTGVGLKEAKSVCDFLRLSISEGVNRSVNGKIIIDTNLYTAFHFLDSCAARSNSEGCSMLRLVNFDISLRTTSRQAHAALTGQGEIKPKPAKKPAHAITSNEVLKNTAVRLIRMGAVSEAREVLKILM